MMSNYSVSIGNRTYQIRVLSDHLLVDGDRFCFEMESLNNNGQHVLRHPHRSTEAYLEPARGGRYQVQIQGKHLSARVNYGSRPVQEQEASRGALKAPMPGLIIDVPIEEGDLVEEGQTLVIEEAMKMQMKLRAPCPGRIQRIQVQAGEQVEKNAVLILLQPRSN